MTLLDPPAVAFVRALTPMERSQYEAAILVEYDQVVARFVALAEAMRDVQSITANHREGRPAARRPNSVERRLYTIATDAIATAGVES